jgi:ribonuclease HII
MMNWQRKQEVKRLKQELKEMIEWMGITKGLFYRTMPRVKARGYKYYVDNSGRKASLRQQWQFMKDLIEAKKKEEEQNA